MHRDAGNWRCNLRSMNAYGYFHTDRVGRELGSLLVADRACLRSRPLYVVFGKLERFACRQARRPGPQGVMRQPGKRLLWTGNCQARSQAAAMVPGCTLTEHAVPGPAERKPLSTSPSLSKKKEVQRTLTGARLSTRERAEPFALPIERERIVVGFRETVGTRTCSRTRGGLSLRVSPPWGALTGARRPPAPPPQRPAGPLSFQNGGAAAGVEPPPMVRLQDYNGPLKKTVGTFARKLERKSVHQ